MANATFTGLASSTGPTTHVYAMLDGRVLLPDLSPTILLLGTGFTGDVVDSVMFGGNPATDIVVDNDNEISCTVPVASEVGTVSIRITFIHSTTVYSVTLRDSITYQVTRIDSIFNYDPAAPDANDFAVSLLSGGGLARIYGEGFLNASGANIAVFFDDLPSGAGGAVTRPDDTTIICTIPHSTEARLFDITAQFTLDDGTVETHTLTRPYAFVKEIDLQTLPLEGSLINTAYVEAGGSDNIYDPATLVYGGAPNWGTPNVGSLPTDTMVFSAFIHITGFNTTGWNGVPLIFGEPGFVPGAGHFKVGPAAGGIINSLHTFIVAGDGGYAGRVASLPDTGFGGTLPVLYPLGDNTIPFAREAIPFQRFYKQFGKQILTGCGPTADIINNIDVVFTQVNPIVPADFPATRDEFATFLSGWDLGGPTGSGFAFSGTVQPLASGGTSNSAGRFSMSAGVTAYFIRTRYYDIYPYIDAITPAKGRRLTAVTITGIGFAAGATVWFGKNPATNVVVVNDTTITCLAPGGVGLTDVMVINPNGRTATQSDGFAYPNIGINPARGGILGGDTVDILGSFDPGTTVTFDGRPATDVTIVNDQYLTCVTPPHAEGKVTVVVTSGSVVSSLDFNYVITVTTPGVFAGGVKSAVGPVPSVVHTTATVTRGLNNGTLKYLWAAAATNPNATVVIASPTEVNTDITFFTYVPGVYRFVLTVTDEGGNFETADTFIVNVPVPTAPTVVPGPLGPSLDVGDTGD